jgi:type II secretory pathway pseudopilin PulG
MKTLQSIKVSERAFTFAEMGVAVGVLGLLGLVFFQVLQSGLTLSAKNTAVNSAHEEARQGILRLTRDLHASVSVPQLRDTSFNVVDPTLSPSASPSATPPTAAGVSFQNVVPGSPDYVWKDSVSANLIMIKDGASPQPGMRLIIPAWGIEEDIVRTTAGGAANHSNIFTTNFPTGVNTKNSKTHGNSISTTSYAITYYTNRVMYLVKNGNYVADPKGDFTQPTPGTYVQVSPGTGQYHYENGELHYYLRRYNGSAFYWQDVAIVARFLSSPTPFSVPLNRYGGPDNKYIAVQLSARDPKSTNRGYVATSSLLDTRIDYRSRITIFQ